MAGKYHIYLFDVRNNNGKVFEDEIPADSYIPLEEQDNVMVWSWTDEEAPYYCDHNRADIFYNNPDKDGNFIEEKNFLSIFDCHCDSTNILIEKIINVETGEEVFSGELDCYLKHLNEGRVQ